MKNLLNKWLGGSTTWDEEKKLRRATAKDDFLKEAIEGYDAFPNSNHAAAVDRLKAKLPKGKQQDKGLLVSLPRVAAAAAVIGLIGTLFWLQPKIEEPGILSQNSPQVTSSTPIEESTSTSKLSLETPITEPIAAAEPAPTPLPTEKEIIQEKTLPPPIKKKKSIPKPVISPEPAPALLAEENTTVDATEDNIIAVYDDEPLVETADIIAMEMSEPTPENVVAESIEEVEMVKEETSRNAQVAASPRAPVADVAVKKRVLTSSKMQARVAKINYYVGQVQNEDGQPLSDVKVIGLNTPFKTISEMSGDFILETDMPLKNITVSKDGFHTRKIAINQYSDFLNVSLVKKTTNIPGSEEMITLAPKPVNGFVDFFDYLANNTVYPKGVKARGIEREVEIRFYIDENGTPTELKVSNPDDFGFDKEAIRLLENGPKWEPANSHARYYVHFEKE